MTFIRLKLELTGNLSKLCWIDAALDNTLEFWSGSIWQLEVLRVWRVGRTSWRRAVRPPELVETVKTYG
jgi:hypothetical protein